LSLTKKGEEYAELDRIISRFRDLSKDDQILRKKDLAIPVGIFANNPLSTLEAVVKYLKEILKLRFSNIGKLINRSNKTIWATYHNAIKKMPSSFGDVSSEVLIPVSIFADRQYSTLENLVRFVKKHDYTNHEVALMLNLDDRTVWTVYDRVKRKRGVKAW